MFKRIFLCIVATISASFAEVKFHPAETFSVHVGGHGVGGFGPSAYDWNKDGKKDILILNSGSVYGVSSVALSENVSTDDSLKFSHQTTEVRLDNGDIIDVPVFFDNNSTPVWEDLNNDGLADLILGDQHGVIHLFEANTDTTFKNGTVLKTDSDTIRVNGYACPLVIDWNEDGLKDLLVAEGTGRKIRLYLNRGTASRYAYSKYTELRAGTQLIQHLHPGICVADVDGDKKMDLLVSGAETDVPDMRPPSAYIYYYRNIGTNASPEFSASEKLLDIDGEPVRGVEYLAFTISDLDNDGTPDLLYADGSSMMQALKFRKGKMYASSVKRIESRDGIRSGNVLLRNNALSIQTRGLSNPIKAQLFSLSGRKLCSVTVTHPEATALKIPMNKYPTGNYIVQCVSNDQVIFSKVVEYLKQ